MAWRKYRPKSDAEALKMALVDAQEHWLKAYKVEHGHDLSPEEHWGGLAWFVANALPSLAWKSHASSEDLIDGMSAYCKAQWDQEQVERTRHQQEIERVHAKIADEAKRRNNEADRR